MLNKFYNRICHLRIAGGLLSDIALIDNALYEFNRRSAINVVSTLAIKYETELNKIAFYLSGKPVIKGEISTLYGNYTLENLADDLYYLKDCLIIIGAVRYGVVKDLEEAINLVVPESYNDDTSDYYEDESTCEENNSFAYAE